MPSVELDTETYERLLVVSRLMDEPVGAVVRRLVQRLAAPDESPAQARPLNPQQDPDDQNKEIAAMPTMTAPDQQWIDIHKIYKGHRVEGAFNPRTLEVRLKTAPWANKYFQSPTGAAVAVVEHFSSDVRSTNNTNGRKFWKITATGNDLRSIIGER